MTDPSVPHSRPPIDDVDDPRTLAGLQHEVDFLRRKLDTMPVIEQAKGVLMHRYDIDATMAFHLLTRWSQALEKRVSLVATVLLEIAQVTEPLAPHADLRTALVAELGGSWRPGTS